VEPVAGRGPLRTIEVPPVERWIDRGPHSVPPSTPATYGRRSASLP